MTDSGLRDWFMSRYTEMISRIKHKACECVCVREDTVKLGGHGNISGGGGISSRADFPPTHTHYIKITHARNYVKTQTLQ